MPVDAGCDVALATEPAVVLSQPVTLSGQAVQLFEGDMDYLQEAGIDIDAVVCRIRSAFCSTRASRGRSGTPPWTCWRAITEIRKKDSLWYGL